jgi:hypothetical protein
MKKLEDIPKKNIFEVPDGYFEKLPTIIQSRVALQKSSSPAFKFGLRFALPAFLIALAVVFWVNRQDTTISAENILASVQTEDLIAYLKEADMTTDELLDDVELDTQDVSEIEKSVYQFDLGDSDLENIIDDIEP